jgi:integrase
MFSSFHIDQKPPSFGHFDYKKHLIECPNSLGANEVKVSSRLGHANPKITLEIYAHLLPNIQDNVAEIFENELSKHQ